MDFHNMNYMYTAQDKVEGCMCPAYKSMNDFKLRLMLPYM